MGTDRDAKFEQQIAQLRTELEHARIERRALSEEVETLRSAFDALALPKALAESEVIASSDPTPRKSEDHDPGKSSGTGIFDESALHALGLSEASVARLLEIYESSKMEELYLRDTAIRENWLKTPRYRNELKDVRNQLRNSLSGDDYDRMLYATGRKNRVIISHVLLDSPAMEAGLQEGDVVLRYDDVRIFKSQELQRATSLSTSNQTPMIVLRKGERLRIFLRAGPLGVQLENENVAPSL